VKSFVGYDEIEVYHKTTGGACIASCILQLWVRTRFKQDNKYVNLLVFVRLHCYSQVQNFLPSQSFKARVVLIK
jgi:hypothetical protein